MSDLALVPGLPSDAQENGALPRPVARPSRSSKLIGPAQVLALADFSLPEAGAADRLIRFAYRLGVPGSTLSRPFRRPVKPRLLAGVESPLGGDRGKGAALLAGDLVVAGVRAPVGQVDFGPDARLALPLQRSVHGFLWLRDLRACMPDRQATQTAEQILGAWLDANPEPGTGPAWDVENAGQRLLGWLIHAPLILSGSEKLRARALVAMAETARWLDRNVARADDRLSQVAGWCGIVAAGLLLADGKPRRLFGEAGLVRALGELIGDDGGVLSRSPLAQTEAIELLADLSACYRAVRRDPPQAVGAMLELLVPPLLALLHSDGALGSWQGSGATPAESIARLVEASGVRTRALRDVGHWGYQRIAARDSVLLFDTAPPPLARHARHGCASTLAFEFSHGSQRLIVNCGGAALAGGQVPPALDQGLRASAAHSTLVVDNANSTAVLAGGKLGAGVGVVEIDRQTFEVESGKLATRIEASHDGYASRYGLTHRRVLTLRDDGSELRGEDSVVPAGRRRKHGDIPFAIRFHIGPDIEISPLEDGCSAKLVLKDGTCWQFAAESEELSIEESLWVDGEGRPHPIHQLVIGGTAPRGGGSTSWLLQKMR